VKKASPSQVRKRFQNDPCFFAEKVLGIRLYDLQRNIARSVFKNRYTAVQSCHESGKSYVAAAITIAFLQAFKNSLVITTAPSNKQVKNILWREINQMWHNSKVPLYGTCLTQQINVTPGKWFAVGYAARHTDPSSFQGGHADHVLIIADEAGGIQSGIWDAMKASMGNEHARLLAIGNPTDPTNYFKQFCEQPHVTRFKISAFDTPNLKGGDKIAGLITKQWVDEVAAEYGTDSGYYVSRILGEFPSEGPDTLIPMASIEQAIESELVPDEPNILAVDVARFGNDETVIGHRRGPQFEFVSITTKEDTMQTCGRVIQAFHELKPSEIRIDTVGVGGGVYDRLKEQRFPVVEAVAGMKAQSDSVMPYLNARAEWFWNLRSKFLAGEIKIPKDQKYNSLGKLQMESKDEIKRRGMSSPDRADTLAIAFSGVTSDTAYFGGLSKW
jgi:phage terminase large subunit